MSKEFFENENISTTCAYNPNDTKTQSTSAEINRTIQSYNKSKNSNNTSNDDTSTFSNINEKNYKHINNPHKDNDESESTQNFSNNSQNIDTTSEKPYTDHTLKDSPGVTGKIVHTSIADINTNDTGMRHQ